MEDPQDLDEIYMAENEAEAEADMQKAEAALLRDEKEAR